MSNKAAALFALAAMGCVAMAIGWTWVVLVSLALMFMVML